VPGVLFGHYPENLKPQDSFFSKLTKRIMMPFVWLGTSSHKGYQPFIKLVIANEQKLIKTPDLQLEAHINALRSLLSKDGLTEVLIAESFAVICYIANQKLGIRPYHTQLIAARIMLDGKLAEMATGEGKTLAASICAATAALAGIPVHLITSNDYLVSRDANTLLPIYNALGLSVGTITQALKDQERKAAYACNITYTTAKELVFDYLKDRATKGQLNSSLHHHVANITGKTPNTLLRGLCMAIVDEADSIMIDEARVPLILSQNTQTIDEYDHYRYATFLASTLTKERDFLLNQQNMSVELTDHGHKKIKTATELDKGVWQNTMHRKEVICLALAAQHLYQRDYQYLVKDGKVHIIDEITGRVAPGRVWSRGLHQLIEIKEGCTPSSELMTLAQITYQRFFPRYLKLGGMSGTLSESRREFYAIYGLKITKVPLNKINQRKILPTIIYPNKHDLWNAVVDRVKIIHKSGQPILIGTDSVAESEELSIKLLQAELTHEVLNARQDEQEADIIASAGQKNQITISTNMAGRGTDISLPQDVIALGGIYLISCQHNPSRRIDRQLLGRCARKGQPGSATTLIAMDKPLIKHLFPSWVINIASNKGLSQPAWLVNLIICLPQWLQERQQYSKRYAMMKRDTQLEKELFIPD
jgi:preprotein translocase subunit SecA